VTAVAVSGDASRTDLTITVSKAVDARAFLMEQPERVVIELPEASFRLPASAGRQVQGLVADFRFGLFAHGRSRIVIDLAQPALVSRPVATSEPDGSARLTFELSRAERQAFRKAVAADRPALERASTHAAREIAGHRDQRPVIVLDAGHGGVDPGAIAKTGDHEKDIVLGFAGRLRERLEASGRYRVIMTRDHDVFIPLDERVRIGRAAHADLFISIHADTIADAPHVRGLTVYTGSKQASDEEARRLADRENTADAAAGLESGEDADAVADILQDLTVRETHGLSQRFARKLTGEIKPTMPLTKKPLRQAGFRVLRAADVPAVLVELGYLSSRKDLELLTSSEWRERSTAAMAGAIDRFFGPRLASQALLSSMP
jgi:N-acetylmuramoyl-L-alanine amidase